jgi:hypothetical protein
MECAPVRGVGGGGGGVRARERAAQGAHPTHRLSWRRGLASGSRKDPRARRPPRDRPRPSRPRAGGNGKEWKRRSALAGAQLKERARHKNTSPEGEDAQAGVEEGPRAGGDGRAAAHPDGRPRCPLARRCRSSEGARRHVEQKKSCRRRDSQGVWQKPVPHPLKSGERDGRGGMRAENDLRRAPGAGHTAWAQTRPVPEDQAPSPRLPRVARVP